MKKLITLALCALPCVAFADEMAKPTPEPIAIKKQTVSALPKELYDGWWVTYDRDIHTSYVLRFYLKDGEVHGENRSFHCADSSQVVDNSAFKLIPTAKKGFDLRYADEPDFRSYMTFHAILPKTFLLANQSFADAEMAEMFPKGINWIYLHSDTPTPKCPKG